MKILVCGAGRITDELFKRIGPNWEITLIEKDEAKLAPFSHRFPNVARIMAEDASSPVVLDKAGPIDQDGVLAMTNDDAVNMAIARFAREADVNAGDHYLPAGSVFVQGVFQIRSRAERRRRHRKKKVISRLDAAMEMSNSKGGLK